MSKEKILELIKKHETQGVEFTLRPSEEIGNSICSFANTNDGIILVGVSDKSEIIGCSKKMEHQIANIAHSCKPSVYPEIEEAKVDEKPIFIVKVRKSGAIHSYKNIAYRRVGTHDKPLSPEEVIEFAKVSGRIQFDSEICEKANLEDIDWDFVEGFFIPLYESVSGKKVIGKAKQLLRSLGCLKNDKPTNAGILLFGKNPQQFFLNVYIALARYKGKDIGAERLDYKEFKGNLFRQIDNCDKYIKEHIAIMSRLLPYQVQRQDIPEYGLFSLRELIINAICHRDYSDQGSKVIIKILSDKVEFYNPGCLPKDITPKNIVERQYSRNPVIANVLAKVEYIEELGEGWDKIIKEHKEHPLKPRLPKIKADTYSVLVKIFSASEKFEKEKKTEPRERLSDKEIKIIEFINRQGSIKSGDIQDMFNVSRDTANRYLNRLIKLRMIKRKGVGKSVYYILK